MGHEPTRLVVSHTIAKRVDGFTPSTHTHYDFSFFSSLSTFSALASLAPLAGIRPPMAPPRNAKLGFATFKQHLLFINFENASDKATSRHDVVTAFQFGQHLLMRLGPLLLRSDEQKPENQKHKDERHELHQHFRTACGCAARWGATHGMSYGCKQNAPPMCAKIQEIRSKNCTSVS